MIVYPNIGYTVYPTNKGLAMKHDDVNHPSHYTSHPSGVECIQITEHMNFNLGNAIKYVWRAGLKNEATTVQDLEKAVFYINREIARIRPEEQSCHKTQASETTRKSTPETTQVLQPRSTEPSETMQGELPLENMEPVL